ncbi:MAG: DUF1287 domain-containing protein [Xanthomonadales bacterium]|nr:DUF1287 domain-containing protein [Xanthomonadales bacterium]
MIVRVLGALLGLLALAQPVSAAGDVDRLLAAALGQIGVTTSYDPGYARLSYPGGDVPIDRGVCSDVIIRAMRAVDVDLQVELQRDMRDHFAAYPSLWGLKRPDSNIDHRRVPNLETWFARKGKTLPVTNAAADYLPGDFVSWRLDDGLPHIGIVAAQRSADQLRPLIIHNIGAGVRAEDLLFAWPISGHYRWFSAAAAP